MYRCFVRHGELHGGVGRCAGGYTEGGVDGGTGVERVVIYVMRFWFDSGVVFLGPLGVVYS